jgi:phosphoribosylformylglycinamidine synthase I
LRHDGRNIGRSGPIFKKPRVSTSQYRLTRKISCARRQACLRLGLAGRGHLRYGGAITLTEKGCPMKAAVLTFPGSNCDRDLAVAFAAAGAEVHRVWHKDTGLPEGVDIVAVPGGFSFGDYLRCGAIAAQSPIGAAVRAHAARGGYVLGVCNGFQVLTEMGLLPGALMRNAGLKFICKSVELQVGTADSAYTSGYSAGQVLRIPVAHHDGNYTADAQTRAALKAEDRVAFTYAQDVNGSVDRIAGVLSANRRVLGMMPHPERACEAAHGGTDGAGLFRSIMGALALV